MSTLPLEAQKAQSNIIGTTAPNEPVKNTLADDLIRQYKEELGPDTIPFAHDLMIRQKFGIVPMQSDNTDIGIYFATKRLEAPNGSDSD